MSDRYCELRWKAAEFLQREGYLSNVEWRDTEDGGASKKRQNPFPHHPAVGSLV
jgi:hypothetical protein